MQDDTAWDTSQAVRDSGLGSKPGVKIILTQKDKMQVLDKKLSDLKEEYNAQVAQMELTIDSEREQLQQDHESKVKEKQKQYEL